MFRVHVLRVGRSQLRLELVIDDELVVAESLNRNHLGAIHSEDREVGRDLLCRTAPFEKLGQRDPHIVVERFSDQYGDLGLVQVQV